MGQHNCSPNRAFTWVIYKMGLIRICRLLKMWRWQLFSVIRSRLGLVFVSYILSFLETSYGDDLSSNSPAIHNWVCRITVWWPCRISRSPSKRIMWAPNHSRLTYFAFKYMHLWFVMNVMHLAHHHLHLILFYSQLIQWCYLQREANMHTLLSLPPFSTSRR